VTTVFYTFYTCVMSARVPVRELNQNTSNVIARVKAGETITITQNGEEVATIAPKGGPVSEPTYPFRTDPMGPFADLPVLDGEAPSDDELTGMLRDMGSHGLD
jgi:prevent-host-death family protein